MKHVYCCLQVHTHGFLTFQQSSTASEVANFCIDQNSVKNHGYLFALNQRLSANNGAGAVFYGYLLSTYLQILSYKVDQIIFHACKLYPRAHLKLTILVQCILGLIMLCHCRETADPAILGELEDEICHSDYGCVDFTPTRAFIVTYQGIPPSYGTYDYVRTLEKTI